MTPKEKATKLVDAFYQQIPLERYVATSDEELSWEYISWNRSKECGLIAVDEILRANPHDLLADPYEMYSNNGYWEQVKQEIEKL